MTEGCEFRDLYPQFEALDVAVYGASFDAPAKNKLFKANNAFQYRLLSDTEREMALYYGAADSPGQFFASRITVVLDPEGRWRLVYPNVINTEQHPNDVLADLTAILTD